MVEVWELVLYRVYVRKTMIQNIKVKNICIVDLWKSLYAWLYPRAQPVRVAITLRTTHRGLIYISVRVA